MSSYGVREGTGAGEWMIGEVKGNTAPGETIPR
jgi:hypothetical protein